MAIQPADGKILLAGSSDQGGGYYTFALARYNTDGSLDSSFGNDGLVTTDFGDGNDCRYGRGGPGRRQDRGLRHDARGRQRQYRHDDAFRPGAIQHRRLTGHELRRGQLPGTVTTDFSTLGFASETSSGIMLDANGRLVVAGTATQSTYSSFAVSCYDPGTSSLGVQINDVAPGLRVGRQSGDLHGAIARPLEPGRVHARAGDDGDFSYQIDWGDGSTPGHAGPPPSWTPVPPARPWSARWAASTPTPRPATIMSPRR